MVKTKNDGWQRQEYVRPTIIPVYNYGMGTFGVGQSKVVVSAKFLRIRICADFSTKVIYKCDPHACSCLPSSTLTSIMSMKTVPSSMLQSSTRSRRLPVFLVILLSMRYSMLRYMDCDFYHHIDNGHWFEMIIMMRAWHYVDYA